MVRVLEAMFWQEEVPFKGVARRRLISDAVYVVEKWWMKVVKRGGGEGFRASDIETMLRSMVAMIPRGSEAEKVDRLLADIARRGASLV